MASNILHDPHDPHSPTRDLSLPDLPNNPPSWPDPSPSSTLTSRSLVISPNLHAALEYEERMRSAANPHLATGGGGLPPPPRPKSRSKRPPSPAKSPASTSSQSSPTVSLHSLGAGNTETAPSNPYINPAPRLSFLLRENSLSAVTPNETQDDPHTTVLTASSTRPRDDLPSSPTEPPSPPQHELRRASTELPRTTATLRHNRYFSSFARVEKMLGKGKNALGVFSDPQVRSERRMSDADLPLPLPAVQDKGLKEMLMRPRRRVLERGAKLAAHTYALSAPSSPTNGFIDSRSVAPSLAPSPRTVSPTAVAGHSTASRPSFSHARQTSDISSLGSLSPDSESTHDPPSTVTHTRISISSTIYSANNPSFDNPLYPSLGRSSVSPDRESFIDLASPTFSPHFPYENGPMQSIAFTPSVSECPASYSKNPSSNVEPPSSAAKPQLSRLTTTATTNNATTPSATSTKPPVPTTPKPNFRRSRSAQPPAHRALSPGEAARPTTLVLSAAEAERHNMPSTTNLLNPRERAELVRKTQKLTQLFGQTPGVALEVPDDPVEGCLPVNLTKRKHQRGTLSLSADTLLSGPILASTLHKAPAARAQTGDREDSTAHSFSFVVGRSSEESAGSSRDGGHVIEIGSQEGEPSSDWDSHDGVGRPGRGSPSPASFIDLSDEEAAHDPIAELRAGQTPKARRRRDGPLTSPMSPSTPSLLSLSSAEQAEEDRRRKRDKLAKLHRFLGSRVPAHLVLGTLDEGEPLPDPAPSPQGTVYEQDADSRKVRMPLRRRRSSSAAEFSATWSQDIERLKEDLNDREKAINVRRAVKMEKMFGVAPPQKLYHTRQPVTGSAGGASASANGPPVSPSSPAFSSMRGLSTSPRNINQSSYKAKWKKQARPGTADSSKPLISSDPDDLLDPSQTLSDVYLHYRHSLNSLNDIIDRDDRQSLAELHDYLSGNQPDPLPPSPPGAFKVVSPTTKADRRRSLPSRTSMISVTSSELSLTTPTPEDTSFQARRRTAAKLTQFFGVNYRELMNEILDSIEKGLEDERGRGSMKPAEVRDLQQKLVRLKTKRDHFA